VHVGGERFELDLLRVLNEVRIRQIPRLRNQQVFVRVNQKVEGTRRLEQWKEGDGGGDLADNGGYVLPNLFDAPFFRLGIGGHLLVHFYVELPSLHRLVRLDALDDNDEPLDGLFEKPVFELNGDGVQVILEDFVRRDQNRQSVLLLAHERFRWINPTLIENAVDSIVEELGNDVGGSFQSDGVALRRATHVCSSYKQNLFFKQIETTQL